MTVRRPPSPTARPGGRSAVSTPSSARPASAARSTGRVRVRPVTPPKGFSRRTAVLLTLVLVVLASLLPSLRAYVKQQQELADLRADVASKQAQVSDLNNQLARWRDDAYVIAQARESFTYVFPGETGYIVRDQPRAVTDSLDPAGAAARRAATARGPWYGTLWRSLDSTGKIQPSDVNR